MWMQSFVSTHPLFMNLCWLLKETIKKLQKPCLCIQLILSMNVHGAEIAILHISGSTVVRSENEEGKVITPNSRLDSCIVSC